MLPTTPVGSDKLTLEIHSAMPPFAIVITCVFRVEVPLTKKLSMAPVPSPMVTVLMVFAMVDEIKTELPPMISTSFVPVIWPG